MFNNYINVKFILLYTKNVKSKKKCKIKKNEKSKKNYKEFNIFFA